MLYHLLYELIYPAKNPIVMGLGHAFAAQVDLVGDLDREDRHDRQEDEQKESVKKAHGILPIPIGPARETFTTEIGQPKFVYFVPSYGVAAFLAQSACCPNGVFIRNLEYGQLHTFYKSHPVRCTRFTAYN